VLLSGQPQPSLAGGFFWNVAHDGGLDLMTDVKRTICQGSGWVCENHPGKAWTEHEGGCQCGVGMPCECNRANGEDTPDAEAIIEEVEGASKRLH
jgi:hypothetical protein